MDSNLHVGLSLDHGLILLIFLFSLTFLSPLLFCMCKLFLRLLYLSRGPYSSCHFSYFTLFFSAYGWRNQILGWFYFHLFLTFVFYPYQVELIRWLATISFSKIFILRILKSMGLLIGVAHDMCHLKGGSLLHAKHHLHALANMKAAILFPYFIGS